MVVETYTRTSIKIEKEILNQVKIEAINREITQSDLIRTYILEGLDRDEKQAKLDVE